MPHIEDGILHAYIDGALDALADGGELPNGMSAADVTAHLSACADCRARLESERDVRERAGLVLRDVSLPRVETPPFAAVESVRRRPGRSIVGMAWAASVFLAVGAGWWGSMLSRDQSGLDRSSSEAPRSTDDLESQPSATDIRAEALADDPGESAPTVAADPGSVRGSVAAAQRPPASTGVQNRGAELAAGDSRMQLQQAATVEPTTPDTSANAVSAETRRFLSETRASAARNPLASGARLLHPQADSQTLQVIPAPPPPLYMTPGPDMRAFESVLAREQSDGLRWHTATAADLAAVAEQLFIVRDASDPVIDVAREIGQTAVRIRQRLPGGEPVELITWRQNAVALDELVVTGALSRRDDADSAAARAARQRAADSAARRPAPAAAPPPSAAQAEVASKAAAREDAAPAFLLNPAEPRELSDGRRELVLRSIPTQTWVAIRADLTPVRLREVMLNVVRRDSAR